MDLARVDFALIPDDPLFAAVIRASQEITEEYYYNTNVIDEKTFPPHLSLHICTVPRETLPQLTAALDALVNTSPLPDITPTGVEPASGGYVMLNIEATPEIGALHEAILEIAAKARDGLEGDKYGSPYIRELFVPHISLAKVERNEQARAAAIGRRTFGKPGVTPSRELDLCDIGERSEQWNVLARLPVKEHPSPE